MNFSMFYNYHHLGDVLLISFIDEEVTNHERRGQIEVLYHENELVGYNIFDISKIMKIRAEGLIVLPPNALIDAINSLLLKEGLTKLTHVERSNFVIGEVVSSEKLIGKYLIKVNIGESVINTINKENIETGSKVVVAISGATLFDNSRIDVSLIDGVKIEGKLCSKKDLNTEDSDDLLIIDDDSNIGTDFFMQEVK